MHDPKGNWNDESEEKGDGYPFVAGTDREHIWGDGPGDCERVEGLNVGSGPDGCSFDCE